MPPVNGAAHRQDQGADCGRDQTPRTGRAASQPSPLVRAARRHSDPGACGAAVDGQEQETTGPEAPINNNTGHAEPAAVLQIAGVAQLSVV